MGPRRRARLRRAATRAGLPGVSFLDAATAASYQHPTTPHGGGGPVLVCDLGTTATATILQPDPTGRYEIIATLHDEHAAGDQIDTLLTERLTSDTDKHASGVDPVTVAAIRTVKQTLSHTAATTLTGADGTAQVVTVRDLTNLAAPVAAALLDLVRRTIDAADLTAEQITAIHTIGASAHLPALTDALRTLGPPVYVPDDPETAALHGALAAIGTPEPTPRLPALRRMLGPLIPGLASLGLLLHVYGSATVDREAGYTLITWGELALAAAFAQITALTLATLIIDTLPPRDAEAAGWTTPPFAARALGAATAAGIAVAALYALTGSLTFTMPTDSFLRWSLLPGTGITLAGLAATVRAFTGRTDLHGTWHTRLAFPTSSIVAAAVGIALMEISITTPLSQDLHLTLAIAGRLGGALLGIGTGLALTQRPLARILTVTPLAIFGAVVAGIPATGYLAIIYTTTASIHYLTATTRLYLTDAPRREGTVPPQPVLDNREDTDAARSSLSPDADEMSTP